MFDFRIFAITVPYPVVLTNTSKVVPLFGDTWVIEVTDLPVAVPLREILDGVKVLASIG